MALTQVDLAGLVTGVLPLANGGSGSATAFNAYISGTGYQKMPSGIILQWGTLPFNSSGVANVTFATAFPTQCLFVTASVQRGGTLSGYLMSTQVGSYNTTGVTIIGNYTTGGSVANLTGNEATAWIAIGY